MAIRPCTLVYLVMVVLTLVTWAVSTTGMTGFWISMLVLSLALLKGHLIGDWFMGLRGLKSVWRWVVVVWLMVPGLLITSAFTMAN